MIPRLKLPITVTDGKFSVVEQDTVGEVAQCCFSSLSTEEGSRIELAEFGLPAQNFKAGGVDETEIRNTIERDEPRATEILTETQWEALLSQRVRVTVGVG